MNKSLGFATALLGLLAFAGCSTTSRYVTAEHWPNRDNFFVAYTEYTSTNYLVTQSGKSSAHVMLCEANASNEVSCRPQPAVDRLLNPHEDYPDSPPPPPAQHADEAGAEDAAEAEPASSDEEASVSESEGASDSTGDDADAE